MATTDLPADDPRHGSTAGKSAGCDCFACRVAESAWARNRTRKIAYGVWAPWVDAEPVRQHLLHLRKHGIGRAQVAKLSGLHEATVNTILRPRPGSTQPPPHVRPETAAAILAVQPTLDNVADAASVDATCTLRKLRALVAQGHTVRDLGRRLPMHEDAAYRLVSRGTRCTALVARATRDIFSELWDGRPEGREHDRARRMAAARGWAPPGAWEDIDDPADRPKLSGPRCAVVDEAKVWRATGGERIDLTPRERRMAVDILTRQRRTAEEIADVLGISERRVVSNRTRARRVAA